MAQVNKVLSRSLQGLCPSAEAMLPFTQKPHSPCPVPQLLYDHYLETRAPPADSVLRRASFLKFQ